MTWFRVDDSFHCHPKRLALAGRDRGALALWLLAGSWSAQQLTDGHVPNSVLKSLGTPFEARSLVSVGLWEPTPQGWVFHDWADWQVGRDEVLAARERERIRKRNYRARRVAAGQPPESTTRPAGVPPGQGRPGPTGQGRARPRGTNPDVPLGVPGDRDVHNQTNNQKEPPVLRTGGADTLIGEWLEAAQQRPPKAVVGQVARTVAGLLAEGLDPAVVRQGLAAWATKGIHPSTLPSVVHEVQVSAGRNGRPATTDARVRQNLAMVQHFAEQEGLT